MANQDFGGEMQFSWNGNKLTIRAKFEHEPVPFEMDGGANQDGSTYRTVKPSGYMAEPTFEDNDTSTPTTLDWEAIMRGGPYNMTLLETQTRTLFTWTNAKFEGKPRVDRMNGEVTGIKIRTPLGGYNKRAA